MTSNDTSAKRDKKIYHVEDSQVIVLDAGNSVIKCSILGDFGREIDFPHAVHETTESDYERETRSARYNTATYKPPIKGGIMKYKVNGSWVHVSVGQPALNYADGYTRLLGPAKYRKDHLGPIFVTSMIQLGFCSDLPTGYDGIEFDDIHVVGLHPTDVDENQLREYIGAILGVHFFELPNGKKVKFHVKKFTPTTEAASILTTFMLNTDGALYDYYGNSGQRMNFDSDETRILVVDVGGGLISIAPVLVTGSGVDMSIGASAVVPIGVANVIDKFKSEVKNTFSDKIGKVQRIVDDHIFRAALRDGVIQFDGRLSESYQCNEEVERSIPSLINALREKVNRDFSGGVGFDYIVIGGGGGGIMFKYIRELVFNNRPGVFTAEFDNSRMPYGAVRGAGKGFLQSISSSSKKSRRR